MFNPFKKRPRAVRLSLVELSRDGYCAVVGESHYQDALRATRKICSIGPDSRPTFSAVLLPEPDNPYDSSAIAVHSSQGKLGHLSRENAAKYRELFGEVIRLGYHGGACEAYLTGGELDKPSFGVVLQLADPRNCLAELRDDDHGEPAYDE